MAAAASLIVAIVLGAELVVRWKGAADPLSRAGE
jgi:hypothetical protein